MILVIDDHADTCDSVARRLELAGFDTQCVASAEYGVGVIYTRRPQLVILDDYLPGLTGIDLLPMLRSDPALLDLPIIIYTAGKDDGRRHLGLERGATAWIEKGANSWVQISELCRRYVTPEHTAGQ